MPYLISKYLLMRMPAKDPSDYRSNMQTFLTDHYFKTALYLASPGFYNSIARHNFQATMLTEKETNTLRKYINRYCFRPTPFGLFSSVTLLNWVDSIKKTSDPARFKIHVNASMTIQNRIGVELSEQHLPASAVFRPNPSIYRLMNEYRFFRTSPDGTGKHREYQLQSIAFSKLLKDLAGIERKGCSREQIVTRIIHSAGCSTEEGEEYADFLIDAQLLISDIQLSIVGEDPLTQLLKKYSKSDITLELRDILRRLAEVNELKDFELIIPLDQALGKLLTSKTEITDKLNVILKREMAGAAPASGYQDQLRDGLTALTAIATDGVPAAMTQFIEKFQQHFEGQSLPLLRAIDPEAGIGYQYPETEKNNPMLETLDIPYKERSRQGVNWSAAHSTLMEAWLRDRTADPVLRLNDNDLRFLNAGKGSQPILGMSVLFRIAENKLFIENAGGINSTALIGRFTVADEKISRAAQEMAGQLEAMNPDIIFAELLHLADPHTDNVNRRTHLYQYEIPITATSLLPESQQIPLSDLFVRIIDNKAMLFSETHQKFVIPRLSSAYNHGLNKLPLFRFLTDLPYQYGRSDLSLSLRSFFPNLSFYPRVEYNDTILSLATWILSTEQIAGLIQSDGEQIAAFTDLRTSVRLPRYFSLAEGDQELVFDTQNESDILFFCNCIRQKKQAVLKEFLTQPFVQQFNGFLLPAEPLQFPRFRPGTANRTQRKFMPGSEWLYLKLYAPKIGVNRLLLKLYPFTGKRYGNYRIEQWFFVRYQDHAPHIRLRLKVSPEAISDILIAFKNQFEDRIQQHLIREFQIDVYSRELERYAAGGIENTESFFWASSELVLQFLKQQHATDSVSTHSFALYSTWAIIKAFIHNADEQLSFTLNSFQQFLPEFTDQSFKVVLDRKYRELSQGITAEFKIADRRLLSGSERAGKNFTRQLNIISKSMAKKNGQADYLQSIIHLHLNRVFTEESRKQEMISYYLLYKYLLSEKGRNKKNLLNE